MSLRAFASLVSCGLFFTAGAVAADPAPAALYNKSIVLAWTENWSQKADSGEVKHSATMWVYVSGAGRLFSRFTGFTTAP
jgi:hypothetical protein